MGKYGKFIKFNRDFEKIFPKKNSHSLPSKAYYTCFLRLNQEAEYANNRLKDREGGGGGRAKGVLKVFCGSDVSGRKP